MCFKQVFQTIGFENVILYFFVIIITVSVCVCVCVIYFIFLFFFVRRVVLYRLKQPVFTVCPVCPVSSLRIRIWECVF
jgi:hypothetical protein